MGRRCFDHLVAEISVRAGQPVSRWALWLRLRELGSDPEQLSRAEAVAFCDVALPRFLREHCILVSARDLRRLRKTIARLDPTRPTPEERFAEG